MFSADSIFDRLVRFLLDGPDDCNVFEDLRVDGFRAGLREELGAAGLRRGVERRGLGAELLPNLVSAARLD